MSAPKFTQGPWGYNYIKPEARPFDRWIISTPCGDMILQSPFQVGDEQHAANAHLLASAPELYAALQNIDANAAESVEWIRRVARAALRKAEDGASLAVSYQFETDAQ